jgi:hypothetical protein
VDSVIAGVEQKWFQRFPKHKHEPRSGDMRLRRERSHAKGRRSAQRVGGTALLVRIEANRMMDFCFSL